MKDILLTIGVPTYNQPRAFERTLQSIIPQITEDVEILVRDDSTNNETEEIVKKFIAADIPITYIHGEKIGLDAADFFIVEQAQGKYVWWFGDDEMAPGAIEYVLRLLKDHPDISLVWVNSLDKGTQSLSVDLGPSRFFKDGNEALELLSDMINFLSAIIQKKEEGLKAIPLARKFIGTWVAACLEPLLVLAGTGRFYYLSNPYIITNPRRPDETLWYDEFKVYALDYPLALRELKGKFKRRSLRTALKKTWGGVWRGIIVHRAKAYPTKLGSFELTWKSFWLLFRRYWSFGGFWALTLLLLMPRSLVRRAYRSYKGYNPKTYDRLKVR